VERAADVCLKERRRLVLVVRETPLSLVHLRNMVAVTEAGAVVLPASPAFYQKPRTIDDLADFIAGRVLNLFGVPQTLFPAWGEPQKD
jgi:4-hydroxy-3-polyprenylbenzoate decarboxylase